MCSEGFDQNAADAVCSSLEFGGGVPSNDYNMEDGVIWVTDVECSVGKASLLDCAFTGLAAGECNGPIAGVECFDLTCQPASDNYRLIDSEGNEVDAIDTPGRLEICNDNIWGRSTVTTSLHYLSYPLGGSEMTTYGVDSQWQLGYII